MKTIQETINRIKNEIDFYEEHSKDTYNENELCWGMEEGVLLTISEARKFIEIINLSSGSMSITSEEIRKEIFTWLDSPYPVCDPSDTTDDIMEMIERYLKQELASVGVKILNSAK